MTYIPKQLKKLCDDIVGAADVCEIIIYGRKERLHGGGIKEVNLCVIVEENAAEAEKKLYREIDTELVFNLLVYDRATWEKLTLDGTSYAASIVNKGVVLYGKPQSESSRQ